MSDILMPQVQSSGYTAAVRFHWMIERDIPEVLEIERNSFKNPWPKEYFIRYRRPENGIGIVAMHNEQLVGFMLYKYLKTRIYLINFAVDHRWRRKKVGSQMSSNLIGKLSQQRRSRVLLEVRETNLPAQLFFRAQGFRAVNVLRDWYEDSSEDAYVMSYQVRSIERDIAHTRT